MSEKIISDPQNKQHFQINDHDTPIYMVSIDLTGINRGQVNVIREYISDDLYTKMVTPHNDPGLNGHLVSNIFSRLSDGKIELGYDSGVDFHKLNEELDPNIPSVHVPSFLVRLACQCDDGVLATCIDQIQDIALQITRTGVQDDPVMSNRNYSASAHALDKVDLVTSGKVPVTVASNAIVELDNTYKISDIYAKTQKPLKNLIRRAYLVPPKYYEMHVFDDGVAKLQRMPDKMIHDKKIKDKKTWITWDQMQTIRSHQKAVGHVKGIDKRIK